MEEAVRGRLASARPGLRMDGWRDCVDGGKMEESRIQ